MRKCSFTLGSCEKDGKNYEFRYKDRSYLIVLVEKVGEEEKESISLRTGNMKEAYKKWREYKGEEGRKRR